VRGRAKPWAIPFLKDHPELVLPLVDRNDPFFSAPKLYLEIGMGKGDFIIGMKDKKQGNFLGIERDRNILAIAAKKLLENNWDNVRLLDGDFDDRFEELSSLRFDEIYLNFSDPWPKKRHAKRRLSEANRLKTIASLLKDDGRIVMKTDNPILYEFTLEQIPLAGLTCASYTDHYDLDEKEDVASEYETRFRNEGKPIHRIVITK